ncbi:MAG: V-type ATP synthase subunit A, partial [Spirochaetia bacterium]|nr:V-type ATP synthase subunit A [Spirochaetia bacterium]
FEEPVTQATLKVVGAFHGLSRERSDARKYPAIDPLSSWSKYQGVIKQAKVEYARRILFRGSEINQMMKVVGEEGTSVADYITYQKSELIDAFYLQQNSFDPVDSSVPVERQRHSFDLLFKVLASEFDLEDKKKVRSFFNTIRQDFLDWNNVEFNSERFKQIEEKIEANYKAKQVSVDPDAEKLI